MQLSLDPPISALADATFKLLKMNHWFDAIIVVDDTSSSDLFSYRQVRYSFFFFFGGKTKIGLKVKAFEVRGA